MKLIFRNIFMNKFLCEFVDLALINKVAKKTKFNSVV